MDLYEDIKSLKKKSLEERKTRADDRWVAPYYQGLQDFRAGQSIWSVGTVGRGCDNCIEEQIITGEMKLDSFNYMCFLAKSKNVTVLHRFNAIGCCIFFTKEEAENSLNERMQKYLK